MKLSTRTRYGLRALLDIALSYGGEPVQIKSLALRQDISHKYLEQLVAILKSADVLRSIRGPRGGYVLSRPPGEIRLSEVFRVLEGPVLTVDCVEHAEICPNCPGCVTRQIWKELNDAMFGVLDSRTLKDLVEMVNKADKTVNYQI